MNMNPILSKDKKTSKAKRAGVIAAVAGSCMVATAIASATPASAVMLRNVTRTFVNTGKTVLSSLGGSYSSVMPGVNRRVSPNILKRVEFFNNGAGSGTRVIPKYDPNPARSILGVNNLITHFSAIINANR